jgi:hypothetical protein
MTATRTQLTWISHQFECFEGRAGFQPRRREGRLPEFALVRCTISLTNCSAHEREGQGVRFAGTAGLKPRPSATVGQKSGLKVSPLRRRKNA